MYPSDGRGWSFEDDEEVVGAMGCHLTWTDLHGIDKSTLGRERQLIEGMEIDFSSRPSHWLSVCNLLGFVYYSLWLVQEAEEKFSEVIAKDGSNMNALGNLIIIYKSQSRMKQYRETLGILRILVARQDALNMARSYSDRAFALRFFQEHRRSFTYLPFTRKAVETGKELGTPEEAEWLFAHGLALHRRFMQMLNSGAAVQVHSEVGFREVVECLFQVTKIEGASPDFKTMPWVFIGALLSLFPGKILADVVQDDSSFLSATDCFDRALKLQPEDPEVLARVGAQYVELKMFDQASDILNKSLSIKESLLAFRHRAILSIKMYEDENVRTQLPEAELDGLLQKALSDLKHAIELKETNAALSDQGYIYFLMRQPKKALQCFSMATKCDHLEDNFDPSVTHERWAKCLSTLGEEEGALMQLRKMETAKMKLREQATVLEEAWRHRHGLNCQGFECDLARFDFCTEDRHGYVNVFGTSSVPISVRYFARNRGSFRYDFFVSFAHIDNKWTVALVKRLESEFGVRGNIRYRDYHLGAAISDNIAESVANSYRTLIIMTPDSLRDQWCRYEVQRAHMTNLQRRCAVPIMLRMCQVPRELEHLTFIKCQKGQFRTEDWHRLGLSLCQHVDQSHSDWPEGYHL
ncbi:uncharacterized protein [Asterias amurensis]|uniref:uncharacterized protein n=1 Tax=Asterias amurensis TaxID=7602 RepID=UPI003AB12E94